jgi:hypothetical protein
MVQFNAQSDNSLTHLLCLPTPFGRFHMQTVPTAPAQEDRCKNEPTPIC